ncbi:MAG: 4'-phosphopantetheinyl transferase superfamily protein [Clostridia bacterium]|nr:4'-phosphopantetheinyl transferase superfamily protein [Clostridia bacterium]
MIRILAVPLSQLPSRESLCDAIPSEWLHVWQKQHASCHREEQARASLGGLWLLLRLGYAGGIAYTENGRPVATEPRMDFSITHTRSFVFCALAEGEKGIRIGLDAEAVSTYPRERMERLCARWFSEEERAFWKEAPTAERFTELWTKKEAVVKRSGEGLCAVAGTDVTDPTEAFAVYRCGDHMVTLCHPREEAPPQDIEWAEG